MSKPQPKGDAEATVRTCPPSAKVYTTRSSKAATAVSNSAKQTSTQNAEKATPEKQYPNSTGKNKEDNVAAPDEAHNSPIDNMPEGPLQVIIDIVETIIEQHKPPIETKRLLEDILQYISRIDKDKKKDD